MALAVAALAAATAAGGVHGLVTRYFPGAGHTAPLDIRREFKPILSQSTIEGVREITWLDPRAIRRVAHFSTPRGTYDVYVAPLTRPGSLCTLTVEGRTTVVDQWCNYPPAGRRYGVIRGRPRSSPACGRSPGGPRPARRRLGEGPLRGRHGDRGGPRSGLVRVPRRPGPAAARAPPGGRRHHPHGRHQAAPVPLLPGLHPAAAGTSARDHELRFRRRRFRARVLRQRATREGAHGSRSRVTGRTRACPAPSDPP